MVALWSHTVEGEGSPELAVEADRVLVSTGKQTLVVSPKGDVLERYEPPLRGLPSAPFGDGRYALAEGSLLKLDAHGGVISQAAIALDQIEPHLAGFALGARQGSADIDEAVDRLFRGWWWNAFVKADCERGRLLAFGVTLPWLAELRTDGYVDWVRLGRAKVHCCNSAEVVTNDGTVAHFSSCGSWISFLTSDGHLVSTHDIEGTPTQLFVNGRGVAYVTDLDGRIAAYRPVLGLTNSVEVPNLRRAGCRDGVLYGAIKHPSDGVVLVAFPEPA